jgi:hypothetical protein
MPVDSTDATRKRDAETSVSAPFQDNGYTVTDSMFTERSSSSRRETVKRRAPLAESSARDAQVVSCPVHHRERNPVTRR